MNKRPQWSAISLLLFTVLLCVVPARTRAALPEVKDPIPADLVQESWSTRRGAPSRADLQGDGEWIPMVSGTTEALYSVSGSSGRYVFAAGADGTILRYDGSGWSGMNSGVTDCLRGIWVNDDSDAFAVGDKGTILHYDGDSWTKMTNGITGDTLRAVWGSSGNDVFAVGGHTVWRYDGNAWTISTSTGTGILTGVWGTGPDDVFVVGQNGVILHYDGDVWSAMTGGATNNLYSVGGSGTSDVYATSDYWGTGRLLQYDGNEWSPIIGERGEALSGVWSRRGGCVFVVGWDLRIIDVEPYLVQVGYIGQYEAGEWTHRPVDTTENLGAVWGSSDKGVFAVGNGGVILHRGRALIHLPLVVHNE